MKFRTRYDESCYKSALDFEGQESLTEQNHKDMCDVNNIIARYDRTGLLNHVNEGLAMYGDYTTVNEFQESLNFVMRAQAMFDGLPSDVRKMFGNNPGTFFEYVTNPENEEKCVQMGLIAGAELPIAEPQEQPKEVGQ